MKVIKTYFLLGVFVALVSSCETNTLVFPEKINSSGPVDSINILIKPTDVKIVGDYKKTFIFHWPKFSDKVEKIKITYLEGTNEKEILVSELTNNFELATEQIGEYNFIIASIGKDGTLSKSVSKKAVNKGGLYIDEIIQYVSASSNGYNVYVRWSNEQLKKLDLTLNYVDSSGVKKEIVNSSEKNGSFSLSGLYGDKVTLDIKDEDGNVVTKSFNYSLMPTEFNTKERKIGWSATVSSTATQTGDNGGANALIDGNPDTFWHTPYSGTVPPFPHTTTITLNEVKKISEFQLVLRHNKDSESPRDFDFQTSEDGQNFITQQSFVNTTRALKAIVPFKLNTDAYTKYVRFVFKSNNLRANASNVDFMYLGEINFTIKVLTVD